MKVRFVIHLIPVTPERIPEGAIPESMPDFLKHLIRNTMAYRPGDPIIKNKIVEYPDDTPVKLHGGLLIAITENQMLQVSLVKWDRLEKEGPKIKVIFGGNIDMKNLATLLQEMEEDGGWEDGCSCRDCREKNDFAEMMRKIMHADPEKN